MNILTDAQKLVAKINDADILSLGDSLNMNLYIHIYVAVLSAGFLQGTVLCLSTGSPYTCSRISRYVNFVGYADIFP